ncbi:MAG TPA: tetratricopeptide repeat protein [Candidatus Eisenbacteria bacterium]|nr:tetratricopeptide repeat protein [Candidatus Eisenbacteria bacterium]
MAALIAAAALAIALAAPGARPASLPATPSTEAMSLLGQPLSAPPLPDSTRLLYERRLAEAQNEFDHDPKEISNIIWLGRRTAYLGRLRDAIAIYSRGIEQYPTEPRLRRHRGHLYIRQRLFDLAISDLERAARLTAKSMDESEPDGLPNARNIPTSTLKFNIWYHLGLAHYFKGDFVTARTAYLQCLRFSTNPDMRCATSHWYYMTLRRLGRAGEARRLLKPIRRTMDVIENRSYLRLLLMYRGELSVDSLLATGSEAQATIDDATIGYGVANWHFYNGRTVEAERLFQRVIAGPQWPAFGHIAAEAELARMARAKPPAEHP